MFGAKRLDLSLDISDVEGAKIGKWTPQEGNDPRLYITNYTGRDIVLRGRTEGNSLKLAAGASMSFGEEELDMPWVLRFNN